MAAGAAPSAEPTTATTAGVPDQASILRGLSPEAREILDYHRQCHGAKRTAKLTPESARVLEAAVADLGVERLRESVRYMAAKIPAVTELSKALRAAASKRQIDEEQAAKRHGTAGHTAAPAQPKAPAANVRTYEIRRATPDA